MAERRTNFDLNRGDGKNKQRRKPNIKRVNNTGMSKFSDGGGDYHVQQSDSISAATAATTTENSNLNPEDRNGNINLNVNSQSSKNGGGDNHQVHPMNLSDNNIVSNAETPPPPGENINLMTTKTAEKGGENGREIVTIDLTEEDMEEEPEDKISENVNTAEEKNGNSNFSEGISTSDEKLDKNTTDEDTKEMVSALTSPADTFHSLENSSDEDTTIEEVVNASLIVNLSKNNSSVDMKTSRDSEDSINSSRSCPPDFFEVTASTPTRDHHHKCTVTFDENVSIFPAADDSYTVSPNDSQGNPILEVSSVRKDEDEEEERTFEEEKSIDKSSTTINNFVNEIGPIAAEVVATPTTSKVLETPAASPRPPPPSPVQPLQPTPSEMLHVSAQLEDPEESAADEEVKEINSNFLPQTVTELTAENGVKVFIVGTAHFSEQSQMDVMQTIQKVQPTLVLLELCHSRRNILMLDEETILREAADMSLPKIRSALSQSGTVQGTLHLLLLSMSAQLTKKLGMAPGGEFRVAMREACKIPGCVLLLGDRPFKVTLSRALAALSFTQKCKLAWQFLTSNEDITKEEIEKCKERDLLERMLTDLTGEYPAITRVFVNERDAYLAHSLWLSATSRAHDNKGGPIVGVVGMGHVPGIVKHWGRTTEEQICDIVSVPEKSLTSLVLGKVLKYSFYGLMGYGAYRLSKRFLDFPNPQHQQSVVQHFERLKNAFV